MSSLDSGSAGSQICSPIAPGVPRPSRFGPMTSRLGESDYRIAGPRSPGGLASWPSDALTGCAPTRSGRAAAAPPVRRLAASALAEQFRQRWSFPRCGMRWLRDSARTDVEGWSGALNRWTAVVVGAASTSLRSARAPVCGRSPPELPRMAQVGPGCWYAGAGHLDDAVIKQKGQGRIKSRVHGEWSGPRGTWRPIGRRPSDGDDRRVRLIERNLDSAVG